MDAHTESTPFQRGAVRTACLFVAVGLWIMITNRVLVRIPTLGHVFSQEAVPGTYGPSESWTVLVLVVLFPLMIALGDVAGTTLARALGGRVLSFAASTDFLLCAAAATTTVASTILSATYGAPANEALRGLWVLLASAHLAHARRTAAKVIWVIAGAMLVWTPLQFAHVYPPAFAGAYAALMVTAIVVDSRLTGRGQSAPERSWFAILPLGAAAFVLGTLAFTLVDTGAVLGVNLVPVMDRAVAGDVAALERATERVLATRPGQPVASLYLGEVRVKQARWDDAEFLLRPFASEAWSGGAVGKQATNLLREIERLRALEKKHGAATLALAKAAEAGEGREKPSPEDDLLLSVPLYERAAAKDPAARPELERVRARVGARLDALKPKAAPSPSASPAPRG